MKISIEKVGKEILSNIESYRTDDCLDLNIIGNYLENKLSKGEKHRVENHFKICLYCLYQLNELAELIYLQKHGIPLPKPLFDKLSVLVPRKARNISNIVSNSLEKIVMTFRSWTEYLATRKYAFGGAIVVLLVVFISIYFGLTKRTAEHQVAQILDQLRYASVQILDAQGVRLGKNYGFNIDPNGKIITNLGVFAKGTPSKVKMADGTILPVIGIRVNPSKNFAVIDVKSHNLPFVKLADYPGIKGGKLTVVADPYDLKKGFSDAIANVTSKDIRGKQIGGPLELTYISEHMTKGVIVDAGGKVVGMTISGEKNMGFRISANQIKHLIERQPFVLPAEAMQQPHPEEAVNHYVKGILARDAEDIGTAIKCFKQAIELNPDYEEAYLELAGLYYEKFISSNNQKFLDLEISQYKELIRIDPENSDYHFYLALAYENKGWYSQTVKEYEKVISLDPKDEEARSELGIAYLVLGDVNKAKHQYEALKAIDSPYAYKLKKLIELKQ